jgi:hypothetical protein
LACCEYLPDRAKLDARLLLVAQRTEFRNFLCSAPPQAAKFGCHAEFSHGLFDFCTEFVHRVGEAKNRIADPQPDKPAKRKIVFKPVNRLAFRYRSEPFIRRVDRCRNDEEL